MTRHPALLAGLTGLVVLGTLTGCSLASPGAGSTASGGSAAASAAPSSGALHQKPLTAVPTTCPDPDEITISVKVSLPSVHPDPIGPDKLQCTYYDAAVAGQELAIVFGPSEGATPAQFGQQILAATPSAVAVPGVGDAAYFSTITTGTPTIGAMNFLSGAVFGYVYGNLTFATKEHLTALIADQLLVP